MLKKATSKFALILMFLFGLFMIFFGLFALVNTNNNEGIGILITDHNVRETLNIVDRAYILNQGEILIEGDSQTIANSDIAKKFYLGENFSL